MIINSFTEGIEMIPSDAYLMDDMVGSPALL